jgi:hypothetical protein
MRRSGLSAIPHAASSKQLSAKPEIPKKRSDNHEKKVLEKISQEVQDPFSQVWNVLLPDASACSCKYPPDEHAQELHPWATSASQGLWRLCEHVATRIGSDFAEVSTMNRTTQKIVKAALEADETLTPDQIKAALAILRGQVSQQVSVPLLLTQKQVAFLLGVSRFTVRRMTMEGKLCPVQVNEALRYRRSDIEAIANGEQK